MMNPLSNFYNMHEVMSMQRLTFFSYSESLTINASVLQNNDIQQKKSVIMGVAISRRTCSFMQEALNFSANILY